jgi:protease-4
MRRFLGLVLLGSIAAFVAVGQEKEKPNPFVNPKAAPKGEAKPEEPKAEPKAKPDPDAPVPRVAHVKLSGSLGEMPVAEGPFGGGGENLRSKIDHIRKAAQDDRIKALYLELGSLEIGFGKLNELKSAVAEFRAAGKKVYSYSEEYDAKAYLLALAGDQVVVPESGGLNLIGMRAEVSFYKDLLKLVSLEVDVLKMGKYKSAVEPYILDKMSKENREQMQALVNDHFDNELVAGIVKGRPARKFTAEQVETIIDGGPYTARKALKLGLLDSLQYQDEFEAGFAKQLGVTEVRILRNYGKAKGTAPDFSNPLAMLEMLNPKKPTESKEPKIAVIHIVGGIASGTGGVNPLMGGESCGSDTIVEAIRDAEKNPTVKAIVLRVDSPGGSALASDMMWRAIGVCKKPVVTSMGDTAASGGYYVAMNSRRIFAEPGTLTGSIGVFGMKIVTGGLEERVGVKTEVVSRGKNSGVNSMTFKWNESERQAMTETIDEVYAQFIDKALAGRIAAGQKQMTREKLLDLAGGRVWTGRQAKAAGLVDELGTLDDAIAYAKKEAGIDPKKEMELLNLPKPQSFLEKLMDGDLELPFGLHAEVRKLPGASKALKGLAPVLASPKDAVRMVMPFVVELK